MRLLFFALIFATISPAASAQTKRPSHADCLAQYQAVYSLLNSTYGTLTAEQQTRLDPVLHQLVNSITFLQSAEGQTAYPALCSTDVLATLKRLQGTVNANRPPSLAQAESEAQRAALLKSLDDYQPR